jgi:hypothetical protein
MAEGDASEPSVGAAPGSVVWRSVNDALNDERAAMVEDLTRATAPGFGPMTAGLAGMTAAMTPGFAGTTASMTPAHAAMTTPGVAAMTPGFTSFQGWPPQFFGAGVPGFAWPGAKGFIR